MRYIAKKNEEKFIVTGVKEMTTLTGETVEVEFASKEYEKDKLLELLQAYSLEKEQVMERYDNDIEDMTAILEAIESAE